MDIGVVLSGGMAKGAYQIGALKAINEFIPSEEIKYISCASIGVLNGYAFATNRLDQAEEIWKNVCNTNARMIVNQILKSSILQNSIEKICDEKDDLALDFYTTLFDANNRSVVYKNLRLDKSNSKTRFLKASVAMPIYNKAVQVNGVSYYDGAMIDNIPVHPLMRHKLDYIICIYFDDICYKFENSYFDNKIIKITFPSKSILKQSLVVQQDSIDYMIEEGYTRAKSILQSILSEGYKNTKQIYDAIEYNNVHSKNRKVRITGDLIVTNINKLAQRIAKRKIVV